MAGYKLQGKTANGTMVDIPLAATYDANGNEIATTYATNSDVSEQLATIEEIIKYRLPLAVATWEQINAIGALGIAPQVWKVGDEKPVTLTTGEKIILQIWDFNHDNLTAGGKAPITFGLKDALATTYKMNNSNTNVGGWKQSVMRVTTLGTTIYNLLPADVKAVIKSVDKKTSVGSATSTIETTSDKLWLPSAEEVLGVTTWGRGKEGGVGNWSYDGEGYQYKIFAEAPLPCAHNGVKLMAMNGGSAGTFTIAPDAIDCEADAYRFSTRYGTIWFNMDDESPSYSSEFYAQNVEAIKGRGANATSSGTWWLRSPNYGSSYNFCCVNNNGYSGNSSASYSRGVAFGFCV